MALITSPILHTLLHLCSRIHVIQEIFHLHVVKVNVQISTVICVNGCTQNKILLHFVYTQCNQLQHLATDP